ncbi:hypothetical protein ACFL2U_00905 [Patescibacteria group bacterium]
MQLPILKKGVVGLPEGDIEIDYCTYEEYWELLMSQDTDLEIEVFQHEDFTILKFDNHLGEVQVIFDAENDYVLEIYLELFEDIPLAEFMDFIKTHKFMDYEYIQEIQDVLIVFCLNFMARINGPRDEQGELIEAQRISTLYFFSTDYIKMGATDLAKKIAKAAELQGQQQH